MRIKTAVFRGEKGLPHVKGNGLERHVHAPDDGDAAEEFVVAVDDASAFAGFEGADFAARGTAFEAACPQPGIKHDHENARRPEAAERPPVTT